MGKLASFLEQEGWEVRVIAARAYEAQTLPHSIDPSKVTFTPWYDVDRLFEDLRPTWSKKKGGTADAAPPATSAEPGVEANEPNKIVQFIRSLYRRAYSEMIRWPDNRVGWWTPGIEAGDELLKTWRPDVIYASAPPVTTLLIADSISRRHDIPWIAEFRDLWTDHPYYNYSFVRWLIERVWERRVLKRATALVTVSPYWIKILRDRFSLPIELVMNGYVASDFPPDPAPAIEPKDKLVILYTGHVYTGYRDPTPLFEAIQMLGEEGCRVQVRFIGSNVDHVMDQARRYGVEDQVNCEPPISHRDALRLQMSADVLLHLQWNDPKEAGTISGKLFEYLGARRPILGIGYERGAVAAIVHQSQAGIVANDGKTIADQLRRWLKQKREGGIPGLSADVVDRFTRDKQFALLDSFLSRTLGKPTPAHASAGPGRTSRFQFATDDLKSLPLYEPIVLHADKRPVLLAIVDVEEDFDWRKPFGSESVSVQSLSSLPTAQAIFEQWGVKPAYLIDYPVANADIGVDIIGPWHQGGKCVVGSQLHPWVTPPVVEQVNEFNSYPGNLPAHLEAEKLEALTDLIQRRFGLRPTIYKAGRYGLGPNTAALIERLGYEIDTSVVPYTDFGNRGGPDFSEFECGPFWFGSKRRLLELPVTRHYVGGLSKQAPWLYPLVHQPLWRRLRLGGLLARSSALERITLTPEGMSLNDMKALVNTMMAQGHRFFTLSFHSPSLSPGNTPYVRTQADLTEFLDRLRGFLKYFMQDLGGETMSPFEFHDRVGGEK